jgi:mutator protein MutT
MKKIQRIRVTGIVTKNDKFLILHRVVKPKSLDIWEFPSGTIEFGETPEQAINREVREETGLKAKNKGLFTIGSCEYILQNKKFHEIVIAFMFKVLGYNVKLTQKEKEHTEFKWVSFKELLKIPNLALTVVAILPEMKRYFKRLKI